MTKITRGSDSHTSYSTLRKSREMVNESKKVGDSAQSRAPSYRLAFDDPDFLLKDEQRSVRLLLEWQKPDQALSENDIEATWAVFGSARIQSENKSRQKLQSLKNELENHPEHQDSLKEKIRATEQLLAKSNYYDECVKLTRLLSDPDNTGVEATVITGGGPGIMEAANRGACEAGASSIGLNIVLPSEQEPNPYITPAYCFQFHYFAIRKMHFLVRAKALFAFPGGFGTLDEVLETLTLLQTGRIKRIPVYLFGERFWNSIINFDGLVEEGMISVDDRQLFKFVETAEEAIQDIKLYYQNNGL